MRDVAIDLVDRPQPAEVIAQRYARTDHAVGETLDRLTLGDRSALRRDSVEMPAACRESRAAARFVAGGDQADKRRAEQSARKKQRVHLRVRARGREHDLAAAVLETEKLFELATLPLHLRIDGALEADELRLAQQHLARAGDTGIGTI